MTKYKPKKLPPKLFNKIYSKVPRTAVDLIVKNSNKILLIKRNIEPYEDYWHFPGGTVLKNETIIQTVNRIAEEETHTKVKIQKLLGTIEFINEGGSQRHTISLAHLVKPLSKPTETNNQGEEIKYFSKIPHKTIPEQKNFLKRNKILHP